jgi:hypothetical protein
MTPTLQIRKLSTKKRFEWEEVAELEPRTSVSRSLSLFFPAAHITGERRKSGQFP